jgi:AcrR family transcriptional regulator
MSPRDGTRTGRRPGVSGTRDAIAAAAQRRFAEVGYERATIRAIAEDAGVDPALVLHFFGSKQRLFLSVMALPFDPEEVMAEILAGGRSEAGVRLAGFAVQTLENARSRRVLTGILRAAASEPQAARIVREQFAERIVGAITEGLGVADARLRASLISSQMVGLIMARYVIRVEPLASLGPEELIAALAPNLQRYLTGQLD